MTSLGNTKQKKACILQDSMIPGKNMESKSASTFWKCMAACWKSETCKVGSYVPNNKRCYLKAEFEPQAKKTAWSITNKVKSFDFTCSISVKDISKEATAPVEKPKTKSRSSRKKKKSKLTSKWRPWNIVKTLKSINKPLMKKEAVKKKTEPLCVYKGAIYPDGTINSETKDTAEGCAILCAGTKDCVIATYVGTNSKCILKGKKHKPLTRTDWASDNRVITYDFENKCVGVRPKSSRRAAKEAELENDARDGKAPCRYHNVVLAGGTFLSADAQSIKQCSDLCLKKPQCSAVTFLQEQGRCHVKNKKHKGPLFSKFAVDNGAISLDYRCNRKAYHSFLKKLPAERKIHGIRQACRYKNRRIAGEVVERIDLVTEHECGTACLSSHDCFGIIYRLSSMTCYLKSESHNGPMSTETPGVVSYDFTLDCVPEGKKEGKAPPLVKVIEHLDMVYRGPILRTVLSMATSEDCVEICSKNPKCKAVTYISIPIATKCFLRGKNHGRLYPLKSTESRKVVTYDLDCDKNNKPNRPTSEQPCLLSAKVFTGGFLETKSNIKSPEECFNKCSSVKLCVAATYAPMTKKCFLRDSSREGPKMTEYAVKNKVISYDFLCARKSGEDKFKSDEQNTKNDNSSPNAVTDKSKQSCTFEGQVFTGGFLESKTGVVSSKECFNYCSTLQGCVTATFAPRAQKCFLRDSSREGPITTVFATTNKLLSHDFLCDREMKKDARKSPNKESTKATEGSTKTSDVEKKSADATSKRSCWLKGHVFTGGFLETKPDVGSAKDCFDYCSTLEDCVAATYAPNSKKCFLRDSSREDPTKTDFATENNLVSYDFLCQKTNRNPDKSEATPKEKTEFTEQMPKQPCYLRGKVFTGGFLETKIGLATPKQCSEYCSSLTDCVAATYVPNAKKCFLRDSSREDPIETVYATTNKVVSYDFLCNGKKVVPNKEKPKIVDKKSPVDKKSCILKGQVFQNGLIEVIDSFETATSCSEECFTVEKCVVATYSFKTKKCYLRDKNRVGPIEKQGFISYDKSCLKNAGDEKENKGNSNEQKQKQPENVSFMNNDEPCVLQGMIFTGGFLETVQNVKNALSCSEECSMDDDCVAATYNSNKKTCRLMNDNREGPKKMSGVVSFDFLCKKRPKNPKGEVPKYEKPPILPENQDSEISGGKSAENDQPCVLMGQLFNGGFLETISSVDTPLSCSEECVMNEDCATATYNVKLKTCRLMDKTRVGPKNLPGVISFNFLCSKKSGSTNKINEVNNRVPVKKDSGDESVAADDGPCALQGQFFSGGYLETINSVGKPIDCSEECSMDENCATASYNFKMKTCRLMDKNREGPKKMAGVVSFDFTCQDKSAATKSPQDHKKQSEKENFSGDPADEIFKKFAKNDQPCVMQGQTFTGGFLETIKDVKNPLSCSEECSMDENCAAASFSWKFKSCRLMDQNRSGPKKMPGIVSFDFLCRAKPEDSMRSEPSKSKPPPQQVATKSCLLNGQVFNGGFLKTLIGVTSAKSCFEKCSMDKQCVTATYVPKTKSCSLRNRSRTGPKKTDYATANNVVSYDFLCDKPTSDIENEIKIGDSKVSNDSSQKDKSCVLQGQSFTGGFLEVISSVKSPLSCSDECLMDENCVSATYNIKMKSCRLMNANRVGPKKMPGVVSFDFLCKAEDEADSKLQELSDKNDKKGTKNGSPCAFQGQSFSGGFLETVKSVDDPLTCSDECLMDENCASATYNIKMKTCRLMDKTRSGPKKQPGVVSFDFLCKKNMAPPAQNEKVTDINKGGESKVTSKESNSKRPCILKGQVFTGGFLETKTGVASPQKCSEHCSSNKDCVAATYAPHSKSCFLRDSSRDDPKETAFAAKNEVVSFDFLCANAVSEQKSMSHDEGNKKSTSENLPQTGGKIDKSCLLTGQVFTGGFLETKSDISSMTKCVEICANLEGCAALTYSPNNKGCFLRDSSREGPKKTEFAAKNGVVSYDLTCGKKTNSQASPADKPAPRESNTSGKSTDCLMKNKVFTGGFLERKTDVSSSAKCFELCSQNKDCVTATFAPNAKNCFLRDSSREGPQETEFAFKNNMISYDFSCETKINENGIKTIQDKSGNEVDNNKISTDKKQPCVLKGQIYTGGFLETKKGISSPEKCSEICSTNNECATATYAPNTKSCFLKDETRKGPQVTDFATKNQLVSYDFLCSRGTEQNEVQKSEKISVKTTAAREGVDFNTTQQCTLRGQVFTGGFLETKTEVSSQEECFKTCSENKDCLTATYAPNTKSCFLRDSSREGPKVTEFATKNNMISYDFLCEKEASAKSATVIKQASEKESSGETSEKSSSSSSIIESCTLHGQIFSGGFLETNTEVSSQEDCFKFCSVNKDCATATYAPNKKSCLLRDSTRKGPEKTEFAIKNKIVSYDFLCEEGAKKKSKVTTENVSDGDASEKPCMLQGQVFNGGFLETVKNVESPMPCSEECLMDEDCVTATYNFKLKTCRLMNKNREGPKKFSGVVSFDFLCQNKKQATNTPKDSKKLPSADDSNNDVNTVDSDKEIEDKSGDKAEPCVLQGEVFSGGFLETVNSVEEPLSCSEECSMNENCFAASYNTRLKTCRLMDKTRQGPKKMPGTLSFDFLCKQNPSVSENEPNEKPPADKTAKKSCLLKGKVFTGGFIEKKSDVTSSKSCFDTCKLNEECAAATFAPNTKTCFLRDSSREGPVETVFATTNKLVSYDFKCEEDKSSDDDVSAKSQSKDQTTSVQEDSVVASENEEACVLQGRTFTGGFLETITSVETPISCSDECLMDQDCVTVSYNFKTKACRLMNKDRVGPKAQSGIVSFDFTCKSSQEASQKPDQKIDKQVAPESDTNDQTDDDKPCFLQSQSFTGGFLETVAPVDNPLSCSDECLMNEDCASATYNIKMKTCRLMDKIRTGPKKLSGVVSFDFLCKKKSNVQENSIESPKQDKTPQKTASKKPCVLNGQVFTGGFLDTKKNVETSEKCSELCSSNKECEAASYAPNTKSCFLRDSSRVGPTETVFATKNKIVSFDFACGENMSKLTDDSKTDTAVKQKPESSSINTIEGSTLNQACNLAGQVFTGGYLETKKGIASAEKCFELCSSSKECTTATFAPNTKSCFLRDSSRKGPQGTEFAVKNSMVSYDFKCEEEASKKTEFLNENTSSGNAKGKTPEIMKPSSKRVESCLLHGQIFSGGFLETKTEVLSQEECFKMCSENKDCVTATYAPNAKSCFLRDSTREGPKVTDFAAKNNMISYDFLCEKDASAESASVIKEAPEKDAIDKTSQKADASSKRVESCLLHGQIFSGGFLETKTEVLSQEECFKMCSENKDCVTATYAPNAKSCFLRDSTREGPKVTDFAAKNNMISYDFLCEKDASTKSASVIKEAPEEDASGKTSQKAGASSKKVDSCLLHGQIFSGGFLETKTEVSSQEECFKMCSESKDCATATYAPNAKSCFLRDASREGPKVTDFAAKNNMISYDFLCEKEASAESVIKETPEEDASGKTSQKAGESSNRVDSCLLHGQIFSGGFLETKTEVSSQEECFKMCSENKDCVTATYAPNAKSCFLRDSTREGPKVTDFAAKNNMISYDFLCEKEASSESASVIKEKTGKDASDKTPEKAGASSNRVDSCLLHGQIFSGGFLETKTEVSSQEECFKMCSENEDCVTATYAPNAKSCFLRDSSREGPKATDFAAKNNMISYDFLCEKEASSESASVIKEKPEKDASDKTSQKAGASSKRVESCLLHGQIFSGGFLETKTEVSSQEECFKMCSENKDCVTATYAPNAKSCFLRDSTREGPKVTDFAAKNNMISYDFLCEREASAESASVIKETPKKDASDKTPEKAGASSNRVESCLLHGQIFSGGFLETKTEVSSQEECFKMCSENMDCVTATYAPNAKSCFLRDSTREGPKVTDFAAMNNMISYDFLCEKEASAKKEANAGRNKETSEVFSKSPNKENPCTLPGQIFSGGFIETKKDVLSTEKCFEMCSKNKDCVTATYAPNTKSCFLRDETREGPQATEFAKTNGMISYDFLCEKQAAAKKEAVAEANAEEKVSEVINESSSKENPCTLQGQIFSGGFIETKKDVSSSEKCFEICGQNEDCVSATYAPNTKSCFLRDESREGPQVTEFATENNMISHDFLCEKQASVKKETAAEANENEEISKSSSKSKQENPCTLQGQIFSGGFIETKNDISSSERCFEVCAQNKDCVTATYAPNAKSCFLRDESREGPQVTEFATENNMISHDFLCEKQASVKKETAAEANENEEISKSSSKSKQENPCTLQGQIFSGGFIETKNDISSSERCFEVCAQNKDCVTATYAPNAKSCFLRDESREGPQVTEFAKENNMISHDFLCEKEADQETEYVDDYVEDSKSVEESPGSENIKNEQPCILQGHAYAKGFLETVQNVETALSCSEDCLMHDDCVAASYNSKMKTCRLMNKERSGPIKTPGVVSFDFLCKENLDTDAPNTESKVVHGVEEEIAEDNSVTANTTNLDVNNPKDQPCILYGQIFNGGFLETVNSVESPLSCSEECLMDDECVAASFNVKKKTCRLMDKSKLAPEKMPGVVSFDFLCRSDSVQKSKNTIEDATETKEPEESPPVKSCLLKGQVFTGGFLATENDIESSEICFEECRANIDCAAATFAPNTKSCFLRDSSREGPTETVFASTNGMVSYDFLCDGKVSRQNEMVKDENIADKAGIEIPLNELNGSRSDKEEPPISPHVTNKSADESIRTPSNSSQQLNDERKNKCLLIGKVFTGGFLKKLEEILSSEECFETCSLDEECFAVTYQPKTKNCFLRDSSRDEPLKTDFAVANKIVSYDFLCEGKFIKEVNAESRQTDQQSIEEDSPCILQEQLFQDGLLEVIDSVQSASACSEDCSMDESCAAASYSSETKKCYLRDNRRTGPIARPHFTSFDFSCQNNVSKSTPSGQTVGEKKEGCVMQGYMYTGGLIELLSNVRSAEDCFEECSMMEDCVAATFSPKSRKCLLRNAERRGPIATYFSKLSGLVSIDFLCSNEVERQETKDGSDPCIFNDAYFIGGLIDSMDSVESSDDCFEECSMDDACSVATYNPVSEECFMRDKLRRGPVSSAFARENKLVSYDFACRHANSSVDEAKKVESPKMYALNITSNSTTKGKFPCRIQGQAFTGRTLEILENVLKGSDCSEECAMDSLCVSATYFPTTLKCYLRDNSRNGPVETARSIADKVISYDYTCDPNMVRTTFSNSTGKRTQQSDDGREYCVFKRKSFSGSTLTVKQGLPSPNDCMMSCSSEKLCVAATYNPMNRKCILRSDKGRASSTAYAIYNNIVSFDFQCEGQTEPVDHQTPSKEPCRLPGMFFSGEVLTKIFNVTEETDCVKFCLDTEDCAVGTFNPVLKTCILRDKNRNQATKSESSVAHGVVSFDLLCDADDAATKEAVMKSKNPCRYIGNVFPGPALKIYSDLENEVGCLEKCETTGDCVAVTYNPTSERCVLKDEFRGDPVATENAALDMMVSYDFLCNAASASDVASTSETSSQPVTSEKDLEGHDDSKNSEELDSSEYSDGQENSERDNPETGANKESSNSEGNVSEAPHFSETSPVPDDIDVSDDLVDEVFDSDRQKSADDDNGANSSSDPSADNDINSHEEPSDSITTKSEHPCRLPYTFFNGAAVSIMQDVDDEQICLRKCREADDCFVVTFNPTQKKCLLKDRNARISSTSDDAIAAKIVSYDFLCKEASNSDGSSPDLENIESNTESSEQNDDVSSNFVVKDKCRLPGQYFPGVAMEIIRGIDNEYICFSQCFKSNACIAVTFDPSANKCVLKDEIGDPPLEHTFDPAVVSYDFECSGKEEIIDSENEHSHATKQEVPSGAKCRLLGAFFPGPDGAMKILPNFKDESACFLECADTEECVAVTFNPTTNKCVLKDKGRREPVTNARAVKEKVVSFDFECNGKSASARPTKSESGSPISKKKLETPCILKNQLFSGRYLSALTQIESGDECMQKCATIKKCLVATYIASTKRCYLRDENHGDMETSMWAVDNGAISWDFACSSQPSEMPPDEVLSLPVGSVCRFDNAFFPGGTIKIIDNVASPKECAVKCKNEDKCEAFTFVVKESSCTLKCDLRKDPVSTPWAVQNGAFSFLMEYCNDDDFSTESFDSGLCLNKKFNFFIFWHFIIFWELLHETSPVINSRIHFTSN